MNENLQINTRVKRLINYIEEIDNGYIQIPSFQRDFIWDNAKKKDLFESISWGYPIGSLLLWKPREEYGTTDKIGPYALPKPRTNEFYYILDGFQRLSTIFGCLKNPKKAKNVDEQLRIKEYSIHYDLIKEEFFIPRSLNNLTLTQVPVYTLIDTFEFLTYANKLHNEYGNPDEVLILLERAKKLTTIFSDYTLPSIEIIGGKIEDATEIFTRINSKGSTITPDWMLSALTNNEQKNFNLGKLINNLLTELDTINFGEIKRELIVQCIQNSFGKVYFDTKIDELYNRTDFQEITFKTIESIKKAIKFLYEEVAVISIKLLPYNSQLIFITDFFNQIETPNETQLSKLKEWFWQTTYSNYFTIYSLSKIREAYEQFQSFIQNNSDIILYNDKPDKPFTVINFPNSINFKSVRAKALILFQLNYSNNFNKLDINFVNDFYLYNLFSIKREDGNYPPEGVIPLIENEENILSLKQITGTKKPKELANFIRLGKFKEEFGKIFLTSDMISKDMESILQLRKMLIVTAEKDFVTKLGLLYE